MHFSLLAGLAEDERRQVLATATRRRFARNEVIFHQGDPGDCLHLIQQGRVAVRVTTPLGEVATLNVLGPGWSFGELTLVVPDERRSATIVALEATETLSLHRPEFERLRKLHPSIGDVLVEALASQVRRLSHLVEEAYYVPADVRVFRRLASLVDQYGGTDDESVVVPVNQETLASMAGTTRSTANRALRSAEASEVVKLHRGRVAVLDVDALTDRTRWP